jgi:UDP-2-acetamido-3-amino-2,3-dideoxy-glucuronate N-acetyltransferase
MENVEIGKDSILGQNCFIGRKVIVGDNCKIQNNISLYEGVIIKNKVFIGPSAVFTNVINPRSFIERKDEFMETIIEEGSTIGANATIICGNSIGKYSLIGAGSVVNRKVKDFEVVVGNPIRCIGWISEEGLKLDFSKADYVIVNKKKYILKNQEVYNIQI